MSFLKAEWRNLILANYIIDPAILKSYIPKGTELDFWAEKCYVSLVGFMFKNTRLLGFKIPFHVNFEEINLRFYVKRKDGDTWKRGVVFIKEFVPKWALSYVANTIYKEHYQTVPMKHEWIHSKNNLKISYDWQMKNSWYQIKANAEAKSIKIEKRSETEFITEHYWGYAKVNDHLTNEYEVTHPCWEQYEVKDYNINVDFNKVYGGNFAFLNQLEPSSVILSSGSEITVERRKKLKLKDF